MGRPNRLAQHVREVEWEDIVYILGVVIYCLLCSNAT